MIRRRVVGGEESLLPLEPVIVDYLGAIWRRRQIVAACMLVVILAGAVPLLFARPEYVARALVLARTPALQVGSPPAAGLAIGQTIAANFPAADVVAFAQSDMVEQRIKVGLPPGAATRIRLRASAVGSSGVELAVRGPDPKTVANLANQWAAIVVNEGSKLFATDAMNSYRFFAEQWRSAKQQLSSTEIALNNFNATSDIALSEVRIKALTAQIADYQTTLTGLSVQMDQAKANLAEIDAQLRQQPKVVSLTKAITTDPALLQTANDAARGRLSDLRGVRLTSEEMNPIYTQLAQDKAAASTLLAGLEAKRTRTAQAVTQMTSELAALQRHVVAAQAEQTQLVRSVGEAAKLYEVVINRRTEAGVATAGQTVPVQPIAGAVVPLEPEPIHRTARLGLLVVAGLLVGVIVALGMEVWPTVRPAGVRRAVSAGE